MLRQKRNKSLGQAILAPGLRSGAAVICVVMIFGFGAVSSSSARDICRWTSATSYRYCEPPYVCNREKPGKCKPGPELQRQLDEDERRAAEAEAKRRSRVEQQTTTRVVNRTIRKTWTVQIGTERGFDERRAPECAVLNFGGAPAQFCVGDAARNVTGPIDYGSPNDSRRVPSTRPKTLATGMQNRAQRYAARAGRKMAREVRNFVDALIDSGSLKDAQDYLDKLTNARTNARDNDPRVAMLDEAIADSRRKVAEARAAENSALVTENSSNVTPEPPAPVSSKPRPTPREEALCSFLLDVSEDRPGRPAAPVPAFCDSYRDFLSALAPPSPRSSIEPPIRIRTDEDEDLQKMVEHYTRLGEQSNNAIPPGFGGN